jgi:hypothetical protein
MWMQNRAQVLAAVALSGAIAGGVIAGASAESADYRTGFESPSFVLGTMRGYDPQVNEGWVSFNNSNWPKYIGAIPALISDRQPQSGRQSIEVPGNHLKDPGDGRQAMSIDVYHTSLYLETIVPDILDTTFAVRLNGPSTDAGKGSVDDLISANLHVHFVNADECQDNVASVLLSSSEELWIRQGTDEYAVSVPIRLNTYNQLAFRADLPNRVVRLFIDGRQVLKLPFTGSDGCPLKAPFWMGVNPELVSYTPANTPAGFDAGAYAAFFDTHRMTAYRLVTIDIRPGSRDNPINPRAWGVLPAAVLGSASLDVRQIDPASVRLDLPPGGEGIRPIRWAIEDIASPFPDGNPDLVLKFDNKAVARLLKSAPAGTRIAVQITGNLMPAFDALPFLGEDHVRRVGTAK